MAITFPYGFIITSKEPIDSRLLMTPEQMKEAIRMPDYYLTVCASGDDVGRIFVFNKNNAVDETYGRFRLLSYDDIADHPALADLMSDEEHRLVTDQQIAVWNAKQDALTAGVDYARPSDIPTLLSQLAGDELHRTVTDAEKQAWTQGANAVEVIKVDGVALEPDANKAVNIVLTGKVDKVAGKGLSEADFTNDEKTKLSNIESGAQVNIIETIKVNNAPVAVADKAVNIDISGKVDKVVGKGLSTEDYTTEDQTKLSQIEAGAEVNIIETVKVNNSPLSVNNKTVNIEVPTKVSDLTNDTGFITASTDALENYYDKDQIDEKYSVRMQFKTYASLEDVPQAERNTYTIYLVPSATSKAKNAKDEYIWNATDSAWELIGSTTMKLDIVQDTTKIEINGDSLQEASSARPGIMSKEMYTKLYNIADGAEVNVNADWNAESGDAQILNKPTIPSTLAELAGDATHRTVTDAQIQSWSEHEENVQADWNQTDSTKDDFIKNKPTIPVIPDLQKNAATGSGNVITDFTVSGHSITPVKGVEAVLEGDSRLTDARTPTAHTHAVTDVVGLANVATSGSYNDLSDKPTIPTALSQLTDDNTHRVVSDTEKTAWNAAQANVLEGVLVDDEPLAIVNKGVNIPLTDTVKALLKDYDPKTMSISPWDAELSYNADSVVIRESKIYISIADNNLNHDPSEIGSSYWAEAIGSSSSEGTTTTTITALTYQFGNDVDTEYTVPHKFQSYDFIYSIRTTGDEKRYVQADVYANSANSAIVKLTEPPGVNGMVINMLKCITSSSSSTSQARSEVISTPSTTWSIDNTYKVPMFVQTFRSSDGKGIYGDILQENEQEFNPVTVEFDEALSGYIVYAPSVAMYDFENESNVNISVGDAGYYAVQVVSETDGEGVINPDIFEANGNITINLGSAKTGYVTVAKPAKVVYFDNLSEWSYTHNLNRYVGVQAYLPANGLASAATMEFYNDSTSVCRIVWDVPMSGYMIIV